MKSERTITLHPDGQDVETRMIYCAATETGYEQLSGKSSDAFIARNGKDGEVIPPTAKLDDYLKLAISAIITAYSRNGEEPPVKTEQIIYDCPAEDITLLVTTVIQMRNEWYTVPSVIKKEEHAGDEEPKN